MYTSDPLPEEWLNAELHGESDGSNRAVHAPILLTFELADAVKHTITSTPKC